MPVGYEQAWEQVRALVGERFPQADLSPDELTVEVQGRALYVMVLPFGPDSAVVQVMAPLVAGVADSDELCEAVAMEELRFGRLLCFDDGSGGRSVQLVVRFHGDQLCDAVFDHALAEAAAAANRIEPDFERRFGATFTLEGP